MVLKIFFNIKNSYMTTLRMLLVRLLMIDLNRGINYTSDTLKETIRKMQMELLIERTIRITC